MDISVVVPVYNVKTYLTACLDSIINQDMESFEIIIVDDGSTDGSGESAEQYASQHPHKVRVIHQENQGLGGARNTGIKNAKGKYIAFVDSDDTIESNMLSVLWQEIQKTGAQIAVCGLLCVTDEGKEICKIIDEQPEHISLFFPEKKDILFSSPTACNKLYKTSLFVQNEIWFPSRAWYEDLRTIPKLYTVAKGIVFTNQCLYRYLQRQGSIMQNSNVKRNSEIIDAFDDILSFYQDRQMYSLYEEELTYLAILHIFIAASVRVLKIELSKVLLDDFRAYMDIHFPDFNHNVYLPTLEIKKKIVFNLLYRRKYLLVQLIFRMKSI